MNSQAEMYEREVQVLKAEVTRLNLQVRALEEENQDLRDLKDKLIKERFTICRHIEQTCSCYTEKRKCEHAGTVETADGQTGLRCGKCGERLR